MFKTLVSVLDDGFQWGKSFEADCLMILKDMRYPYPEQVGKTALGAPGSPTTWPTILSMLNWMVELAKVSILICLLHSHHNMVECDSLNEHSSNFSLLFDCIDPLRLA